MCVVLETYPFFIKENCPFYQQEFYIAFQWNCPLLLNFFRSLRGLSFVIFKRCLLVLVRFILRCE